MKKNLLLLLTLCGLLFLNSCKEDEKLPANVIQDDDGVTIELTWLTGSTGTQALLDADLDLGIFESADPDVPVDDSSSGSSFEDLLLDDDYDDDTYTIKVRLFGNYEGVDIDFLITVSGGDKEIEAEGSFSSSVEDGTVVSVVTIKKKGNKYTVNEL